MEQAVGADVVPEWAVRLTRVANKLGALGRELDRERRPDLVRLVADVALDLARAGEAIGAQFAEIEELLRLVQAVRVQRLEVRP